MKIGIIGYGKMGKIRHKETADLYPDVDISWSDPAFPGNPSPEEVIDGSDAVFICTPNFLNLKYTLAALAQGKHVFCEKPPALSYDDLIKIDQVYAGMDTVLIYGFNHRKYDSIIRMKKIIDDERYGKILWMRGRYGKSITQDALSGWRLDKSKSGGGILLDQGVHMVDLMIYFSGGFDIVQSVLTNNLWEVDGIEDNAFLSLYNSNTKTAASVHSTMIEWRHTFSLEVLLETGYMALNGLKTPSGAYGREILTICGDKHERSDITEQIEFKYNNSWAKEIKDFVDAIRRGDRITNIGAAKDVMKIIKEAYDGGWHGT